MVRTEDSSSPAIVTHMKMDEGEARGVELFGADGLGQLNILEPDPEEIPEGLLIDSEATSSSSSASSSSNSSSDSDSDISWDTSPELQGDSAQLQDSAEGRLAGLPPVPFYVPGTWPLMPIKEEEDHMLTPREQPSSLPVFVCSRHTALNVAATEIDNREAVKDYRVLAPTSLRCQLEEYMRHGECYEAAEALFARLTVELAEVHPSGIHVGSTCTVFSNEALDVLSSHVRKQRESSALRVQTVWRMHLSVRSFRVACIAIVTLQRYGRAIIAKRLVSEIRRERVASHSQQVEIVPQEHGETDLAAEHPTEQHKQEISAIKSDGTYMLPEGHESERLYAKSASHDSDGDTQVLDSVFSTSRSEPFRSEISTDCTPKASSGLSSVERDSQQCVVASADIGDYLDSEHFVIDIDEYLEGPTYEPSREVPWERHDADEDVLASADDIETMRLEGLSDDLSSEVPGERHDEDEEIRAGVDDIRILRHVYSHRWMSKSFETQACNGFEIPPENLQLHLSEIGYSTEPTGGVGSMYAEHISNEQHGDRRAFSEKEDLSEFLRCRLRSSRHGSAQHGHQHLSCWLPYEVFCGQHCGHCYREAGH